MTPQDETISLQLARINRLEADLATATKVVTGLQVMNGKLLADSERMDWVHKNIISRTYIDKRMREG